MGVGGAANCRLISKTFITHQKSTMAMPMDCFASMV
jgi:hypothetical protein